MSALPLQASIVASTIGAAKKNYYFRHRKHQHSYQELTGSRIPVPDWLSCFRHTTAVAWGFYSVGVTVASCNYCNDSCMGATADRKYVGNPLFFRSLPSHMPPSLFYMYFLRDFLLLW